ncbi:hypothetical protein, partial [Photobacterium sanguinicancri]
MNFFELIDLTRPYHYTNIVENAIDSKSLIKAKKKYLSLDRKSTFDLHSYALSYFNVKVEWKLNAAVLLNPDEFNVEFASKANNLRAIMPLAMPGFVSSCMNHNRLNRQAEMDLLMLNDRDCLIESKSGFTIPYEEWLDILFKDNVTKALSNHEFANAIGLNIS